MTRVGVDVGGTFTDLVAVRADGTLEIRKVDSTPADPAVGLVRALDALGSREIDALIHGTTVATNALLERRGARVVLLTTAGFEDLLWLRRQDRAALYDLAKHHPPPLLDHADVIGVRERHGPEGVIEPLTEREIARVTKTVQALAPESVAISLLFAFRHPEHEQRLAAALRAALPGTPVAASHEVLPVFREFERTSTTTAEAYLRPTVAAYVSRTAALAEQRGVRSFRIMTSSGGTLSPDQAALRASSLALSGPAGGVVGARLVGEAVGEANLLTLDMGGTSADASVIIGGAAISDGSETVAGIPVSLPSILIETVSAGGGSIASIDAGGALRVGPRSAGAQPGPACYGRGGTEPTVTDACLVLGWLDPHHALAGVVRLDGQAARTAIGTLPVAGIIEVATAVMARALKRVSVARGVDPRGMALLPFGGAGPLFGCGLADQLGMSRIVIPPHPGVLSAFGLAAASERVDLIASLHRPLAELDAHTLSERFAPLGSAAAKTLTGAELTRFADCRFAGQGYEVTVPAPTDDPSDLKRAFLAMHEKRHGHADPAQAVEIVNLRVVAQRAALRREGTPQVRAGGGRAGVGSPSAGRRKITLRDGSIVLADIWPLGELPAGRRISGPAILAAPDATGLIEPGWTGLVHECGAVMVSRA
ncbi:MAG TPA: hydantoinase/oxoprolinase family protein [Gemmatimonadales bacterium]|nr:hydantoinase/oxoprolinase family protein [Gemmatimonadales bacterium]